MLTDGGDDDAAGATLSLTGLVLLGMVFTPVRSGTPALALQLPAFSVAAGGALRLSNCTVLASCSELQLYQSNACSTWAFTTAAQVGGWVAACMGAGTPRRAAAWGVAGGAGGVASAPQRVRRRPHNTSTATFSVRSAMDLLWRHGDTLRSLRLTWAGGCYGQVQVTAQVQGQ